MKKKQSGTKSSIINSFSGMIAYVFVMLSTMATRIAFAHFLGEELLGLNSLYTSILQILQISELGISAAIIVFLYEPIREADREKTKSIMALYRKVYRVFAAFLMLLGLIVQVFVIPRIVKVNTITIRRAHLYFFLFLLGIVCSYLFASSKSIFYAEQKNRIISYVQAVQKVIVGTLQIIMVFYFKSYVVYLVLAIIGYLVENIICHVYILKEHPYLSDRDYTPLSKRKKREIINVIKPIFIVRIADKVLGQTDSLLINHFIDIATLGMYTNYHTIFNACLGLFNPIGSALTSSYGNMVITAKPAERYSAYKKSYAAFHLLVVWVCVMFITFIQDFIAVAYGEKYLLSDSLAIWMTVYLYFYLVKTIYYSYQNALGLQKIDQKQMIIQVFANIIFSILLVMKMGINGIIVGTILSLVIFSVGYKGYAIYKVVFEVKTDLFFRRTICDGLFAFMCCSATFLITKLFVVRTIIALMLKAIVLGGAGTILCVLVMLMSKEHRMLMFSLLNRIKLRRS